MIRNKSLRKVILLMTDVILINIAYILSIHFNSTYGISKEYLSEYALVQVITTIIYFISFYFFRLYDSLWIYASIDEFLSAIGGCIIGIVFSTIVWVFWGLDLPYSINFLAGIFILSFVLASRMSFRIYRRLLTGLKSINRNNVKKVLIVGAGDAGVSTINEIKRHPYAKLRPIGFIDDDKTKIGTSISGVRVLGSINEIHKIVKERSVDEIIIAIPSLKGKYKAELINICRETKCKVKVLPGVYDLINETITFQQIRDVDVEDLLGRDSVTLDCEGISEYITGRRILVTGGGGSIGSELCRQISKFKPGILLILDCYENNAFDLYNELKFMNKELQVKVIIGTITDKKDLSRIFSIYRPEVVFHAAAHKHVTLMEEAPQEAIKNNVFGTLNVVECADQYGTKKFVMISTDKAVNPTNVMGVSKRICEMIIQAVNKISDTEFVAVRFGNVLGSNGSVVPLFKSQIAKGGPVTVTDKNMTRYFMTITEAVQLVLQAGAFAVGGEIFILDMGDPVRIYDLARDLIKLSGLEPDKDIKIEIIGSRPGERLYEELLTAEEGLNSTKNNKIYVSRPAFIDMKELKKDFEELRNIIDNGSEEELIKKLKELVPAYNRKDIN